MPESKINEWQAFISDVSGYVADSQEAVDFALADPGADVISIRRGAQLPDEYGRLPDGPVMFGDVFAEIRLEYFDPELRPELWELAKKAAWGMSLDVEALLAGFRDDLVDGLDAAMGACHHESVSSEWDLCNACAADAAVKVLRELLSAPSPAVNAKAVADEH